MRGRVPTAYAYEKFSNRPLLRAVAVKSKLFCWHNRYGIAFFYYDCIRISAIFLSISSSILIETLLTDIKSPQNSSIQHLINSRPFLHLFNIFACFVERDFL